jgi:hypothetical protein
LPDFAKLCPTLIDCRILFNPVFHGLSILFHVNEALPFFKDINNCLVSICHCRAEKYPDKIRKYNIKTDSYSIFMHPAEPS